jgi:hypothetical protein
LLKKPVKIVPFNVKKRAVVLTGGDCRLSPIHLLELILVSGWIVGAEESQFTEVIAFAKCAHRTLLIFN